MIKKIVSIIVIMSMMCSNLILTAIAEEGPLMPVTQESETVINDDEELKKHLEGLGLDAEKALAALKKGGTYSEHHVTVGRIQPGDSFVSKNIPESIPMEELHTDFSTLPIYDVMNGEYLLGSTEADLRILLIGNPLCSYTIKRVQFIKNMLESLNVEHANLYLLDMGKSVGNEREDAVRFAEENPGVFVARAEDSSDIYRSLFFEVCRTKGKPGGRFPAICVLDSRCVPVYTTIEILFDENELREVLQPYVTVLQGGTDAEGGNSVSSEGIYEEVAQTQPSGTGFQDVRSDAYYADAVTWAAERNITTGTSPTVFDPDIPCTRAQVVTFLWRAAGSPVIDGDSFFTDVNPDSYCYNAVLWAVGQGITSGTSTNTFSPDAPCSRAQAITFLHRYEKSPEASDVITFTDVSSDAYYINAIRWAVEKGIAVGHDTSTFYPNAICTRSQIVTFLYRDMA